MTIKTKKQNKKSVFKTFNKTGDELNKKIPYTKLLYVSLIANILVLIFLIVSGGNIPPEVPLYYGLPEGESQLAQKGSLFIPTLISIVFILINSLFAYFSKDDYMKKTLVIGSFAITFLSVVTTIKIAFLVGSY